MLKCEFDCRKIHLYLLVYLELSMKKSEHTEIFTLTRLAVFASQHSLAALTYGNAAEAAHL